MERALSPIANPCSQLGGSFSGNHMNMCSQRNILTFPFLISQMKLAEETSKPIILRSQQNVTWTTIGVSNGTNAIYTFVTIFHAWQLAVRGDVVENGSDNQVRMLCWEKIVFVRSWKQLPTLMSASAYVRTLWRDSDDIAETGQILVALILN